MIAGLLAHRAALGRLPLPSTGHLVQLHHEGHAPFDGAHVLGIGAGHLDGRLLAGQVHHRALLGGHERPQLQAVVEGQQPLFGAQYDREGPVHQGAGVHRAQGCLEGRLVGGHGVDGLPRGRRHDVGGHLLGEAVATGQQVEQVGDDLGIGLQLAVVAELLHVAAVGIIAGYLAVVDDRPVQQREGVRPAPPARRVGGKASVSRPCPGAIVADAVELPDILRVAHPLEHPHVLPRGGDEGPVDGAVDMEDVPHGVLGLGKAAGWQAHRMGRHEVAPDVRRVLDGRVVFGGHPLLLLAQVVVLQVGFRGSSGLAALVHDMEGVQLGVVGIDAVCGEPAAKAVAAVAHERDGPQDVGAVVAPARAVHHGRDGAARRDTYRAFAV